MERDSLSWRTLRYLSRNAYAVLTFGYSATLVVFWLSERGSSASTATILSLAAVPAIGVLGLRKKRARPWLALVAIALSFQVISVPMDVVADSNGALSLFDFDRYVWGFNLTGWVQQTLSSASLTDATSLVYVALIPFVLLTAVALWRRGGGSFVRFVTAMVLTSYLALLTFILMPTSPPWLGGAAANLVRSPALDGLFGLLSPLSSFIVPDYFASFPSLHAAYTITSAYFLYRTDRKLGAIGGFVVATTLFSTLYLGQHYAVDLLGGAVYALVPCLISERVSHGAGTGAATPSLSG